LAAGINIFRLLDVDDVGGIDAGTPQQGRVTSGSVPRRDRDCPVRTDCGPLEDGPDVILTITSG
jgi:hypothetical protein